MFNLIHGDSRTIMSQLEENSIQTCVTSPPYFMLRDYGEEQQIGFEPDLKKYINDIVEVFDGVKRVLKKDGTLWVNLGDSYAGSGKNGGKPHKLSDKQSTNKGSVAKPTPILEGFKRKDLMGVPWRVAFALQDAGWYLRTEIIWKKNNAMPESVTDRPSRCHEYIFMFSKSINYFMNQESMYTKNNNGKKVKIRNVWEVNNSTGYKDTDGVHYATYPEKLVEPCILMATKIGDCVLDPFNGSGTTGVVSKKLQRNYIGIDISKKFLDMSQRRIEKVPVVNNLLELFT